MLFAWLVLTLDVFQSFSKVGLDCFCFFFFLKLFCSNENLALSSLPFC